MRASVVHLSFRAKRQRVAVYVPSVLIFKTLVPYGQQRDSIESLDLTIGLRMVRAIEHVLLSTI